ncbi:MAG: glycine cleavage system aminomethyltransferase GcvT [Rhodospirillales bacterium]
MPSNPDPQDPVAKTPLYALHEALGGKMVDFAGWRLPVSYPLGIMGEHRHCREKAALFDVSHMGQVQLHGPGAAKALEALVPSTLQELPEGKARYSFFTNAAGGILDDIIVSNSGQGLFLVVNASMREQDLALLRDGLTGIEIEVLSDRALLAVQGPAAEAVVAPLAPQARELTFMQTLRCEILGRACRLSRLGYTGEDGFEISVPAEGAEALARRLLEHPDLAPAGLGARDSLRLEAGLPLYGNDLDPETSPVEAGLAWAIQKRRRSEGGFPGAARILRELEQGPTRKLVGLRPEGRAPARRGVEVVDGAGLRAGEISSGGFGPSLEAPLSLAYVKQELSAPGTPLGLQVRGKTLPAQVVPLPFVAHRYKR